ncbi:MAG: phage portal protein [Phycisphaeraceae bacterium]|nr:phage portal protein [Phycisphaeraceae bacterium]
MSLWTTLKQTFRRTGYLRASLGQNDGWQGLSSRMRPFDAENAVGRFRSWVYAAAMLNAHAVASVPLRMYVRRRPGRKLFQTRKPSAAARAYLIGEQGDALRPSRVVQHKASHWRGDFELLSEPHPALDLLSTVNPYHNGFELSVLRMLYLQITGNCFLHVVSDPMLRRPEELWLMPSQWTSVLPSGAGFIAGYEYGRDFTEKLTFSPDEVIHWKLPSLDHLHLGMGRLEAVWSALALHDAKRTMDLARFDNHARPDFLLVVKQGASGEALDRFEKQVDQKLRGTRKSGRFIAITGDVQAVPLNFPPELIGDADRVLEEIAAGFGVPISKLLANDPNRSVAGVNDAAWLRDTILPYCRLDEEKLNEKYLPLFGIEDDAFLAYDNPVPEDRRFQLDRRTRYVRGGILTPNEARAEEGLDPRPDGDCLASSASSSR